MPNEEVAAKVSELKKKQIEDREPEPKPVVWEEDRHYPLSSEEALRIENVYLKQQILESQIGQLNYNIRGARDIPEEFDIAIDPRNPGVFRLRRKDPS